MDDAVTHHRGPYGGRYTIERELGRGGMATVYRALDLRHDRPVALKILHPEYARLGGERFAREIRLLAGLRHPNILPLFDSGEEDGVVFYVVPCIEGESLRRRLERERQLPLEDAIRLTREIADALDYAHRQGIIHRDIKPENILLEEGHAIVADFGVARAMTRAAGESQTTAGMVVGTVEYMSPEQASGDTEIDARADQYSLACVLYEMLVGRPPFAGATPRITIARRFAEAPPSLRGDRDVPEGLDRAIRRALSPVPADRFSNVRAFADALAEVSVPRRARRTVLTLGAPAAAAIAVALILWLAGPSGANTLDPGLHAVIPFTVASDSAPRGFDGATVARHLSRAMGFWRDVRLVDPLRASDAVERHGAPRTLEEAIDVARALGAGHLFWGDVWSRGDSVEIRAGLYNVQTSREERTASVVMAAVVTDVGPIFDALSDSLALGTPRTRAAGAAVRGTRVREAFLRFEGGHDALSSWDLTRAEHEFRRASDLDPLFAQASLWTAQVMAWTRRHPSEWRTKAAEAVTMGEALDTRERALATGLLALSEARFPDACDEYRALLARDSLDFAAWYGMGDCQSRDPIVERDSRSPSGWRFRGSWYSGLKAYMRAIEILPSFHRARRSGDVSPMPIELFPIDPGVIRRGYALTPDTVRYAAAPGLEGDTLALVPHPIVDVLQGRSGAWPATNDAAIGWARHQLLRTAEQWTRDFPASAPAHEAVAAAREAVGQLRDALEANSVARSLATDPEMLTRLAVGAARLHIKSRDFEHARRVADSALNTRRSSISIAESGYLSGLAALVGRAHLSRELLVALADDSIPRFFYQGSPVSVPRPLARDAYALLAYASFPTYRDSVRVILERVRESISRGSPPAEREKLRDALLATSLTRGYWTIGAEAALTVSVPSPLHRMQRAHASGNVAAVRAIADSAQARRSSRTSGAGGTDLLHHEALVLLAIGDTTDAIGRLDQALEGLSHAPTWLLDDVHRAAAIGAAMRVRAELAGARGDAATAQRWARAAISLWDGGDPEVRATLASLRRWS
ncbi:MAG TPA: serine/threonine-protein kinase [Gemmatimonadaceae bacterium]|nr:serine/threonine-protein kinase [Gemmatimonadaceae bacterium]